MAYILLVEDDASMRHFLSNALERAGHELLLCADALEALHHLTSVKDRKFDLLLTDIVMPGMDGIQLSQKAAEIAPHLKVMFMTGFSAVVMNRKDMVKDAPLMSKPFHLKDLVAQVEALLAT